jgi:hypothetical protein
MKKRIRKSSLLHSRAVIAVSLLVLAAVAIVPATALTVSGAGAPPSARAAAGQSTLTPAAPVASKVLSPSAEDIRDIRQPRHVPSPPWVAVAAGVFFLGVAAALAWKWFRRGKFRAPLPHELALQELERARLLMNSDYAREYCFAVSQIIRRYLEVQFRVRASRLTTEEFLHELLEARETMLTSHCTLLSDFLRHCDLAKFAGWRCSLPDLEALHASAITFVQQTAFGAAQLNCSGARLTASATGSEAPGYGRLGTATSNQKSI